MLRQLLALPAPTPRGGAADEEANNPKLRPLEFYDKERPPADDAPIDDLTDYWRRWANSYDRPTPSAIVQSRMLDEYSAHPADLPETLGTFETSAETAARVKEVYDNALNDPKFDGAWRQAVKKWLTFNSKYFLNDLLRLANKVRDDEKYGGVDNPEALIALATVDWSAAEPLVQSLADGDQRRSASFALTLLYKQAVTTKDASKEENYRARLQAITSDRNAFAYSRDAAIDALSLTEWSGRDDWYLSLFQDETLVSLHDDNRWFSPLTTLFVTDPDKWIPVMSKLVESKDRTIRSGAASCLIIFQNQNARKDALKPLLPWLSNPDWVDVRSLGRLRLIQSMGKVDLPESVPGLIWVIEHDDSESASDRAYAAEAVAKYKDPRAAPALKKALGLEKDQRQRQLILEGLLASGGLSETEQVDALETYAAGIATAEGRNEINSYRAYGAEPLPLQVSIGFFLSMIDDVPETLVHAVLVREETLKKSNPALAQSLLQITRRWRGKQVELDLIHRIATGNPDVNTVVTALERRSGLRESMLPELQSLTGGPELAPGIAAVLLDDISLAHSVLSSGSESTQIALLACARLVQMPLPVGVVGTLLQQKNQLLALAAQNYLLAEDSTEARDLLWAHHPNAAFVTGWRDQATNIEANFEALNKLEEKLRAELFKESGPIETIGLLTNYTAYPRVLRVYPDKAVYTHYENPARYRERTIPKEELSAFRQFITASNLANLGPQFGQCHYDCWTSEFLVLSKEKGRRVFAREGYSGWEELIQQFDFLGTGDGAQIHYNFENEIKGIEVLYADKTSRVLDIRGAKDELRILLERNEIPDKPERSESSDEEETELSPGARRRQVLARIRANYSWRMFRNDKVGPVTARPADLAAFDHTRFLSDDEESDVLPNRGETQLIGPNSIVMARNFEGLWRQDAGQKAVRISGENGAYASPIVTPDSKWVVVARTDGGWSEPHNVVRFNLQTGREFVVKLPPAEEFAPVAYVAPHGKVLLRRARASYQPSPKSVGPLVPEYYLLDAASGQTEPVSGNFEPLTQDGTRVLQPTGKPNEFWAAIPDRDKDQTQVGRYNLKDFSFQQVLLVPHILFDSMSMWVVNDGTKFFLVYEGQLLRLPLGRIQEPVTK